MQQEDGYKIRELPDDDEIRVVHKQGHLLKSRTNSVPRMEILMSKINNDGTLSSITEAFRIAIPQLHWAKIGSIWKGRELIEGETWENWYPFDHMKNIAFTINLDAGTTVENYAYNAASYENGLKESPFAEHSTTLTVFKLPNNIKLLIPSMELFVNTYTPRHSDILNALLSMPLEKVMKRYIDVNNIECSDSTVKVPVKRKHKRETGIFLGSIACDHFAKSSVSKVWTSIEANSYRRSEGGWVSCPVIQPYLKRFDLKVSGFWLDKERYKLDKHFYVQRIEYFKPYIDKRLALETPVYVTEDKPEESENGVAQTPPKPDETPIDENLEVTSETDPGPNAGKKRVAPGVEIDTSAADITYEDTEITIDQPKPRPSGDVTENPDSLSSGNYSGASESKKTAKIEYELSKEELDTLSMEHSSSLSKYVEYLAHLAKQDFVAEVLFLDRFSNEHRQTVYNLFNADKIEIEGSKSFWVSMAKTDDEDKKFIPRKVLIAKIIFTDKDVEPLFMLEVERKGTEAFYGLLFLCEEHLDSETIDDLMLLIAKNKGHFSGVYWDEKKFPCADYIRYNHPPETDSLTIKLDKYFHKHAKGTLF